MNASDEIWRQRLWVWLPALLFFVANLVAVSIYQLGYAGDVQSLERRYEERKSELSTAQAKRAQLERLIRQARLNSDHIVQLYDQRFSTRRRRLTEITAEVKGLAKKAGLEPRDIVYPEEEIEDFGLVKRSFVFSVEGDYLELRRFINLLELSDSFLTLEDVNLTGDDKQGDQSELQISLTLSTLFAKEGAATDTAGLSTGAATPQGRGEP